MRIPSRFTIAVHTLLLIEYFQDKHKITSDFIANSVQVHPVIIRQILGQLKKAKLIEVQAGIGGASLAQSPKDITLYDIFYAVEALNNNILFAFHENPNLACPIGKNIHKVLDSKHENIQNAMNNELKKTTLADLIKDLENN